MNFYDVLGVDAEADRAEIRQAYREKARDFHPDVNHHPDANDQFTVLTKAREVLTDSEERTAYDRLGHSNYVAKRLDGTLPEPDMRPRSRRDTAADDSEPESRGPDETRGGNSTSSRSSSASESSGRTATPEGSTTSSRGSTGSTESTRTGESPPGQASDSSGRSDAGRTKSSGSSTDRRSDSRTQSGSDRRSRSERETGEERHSGTRDRPSSDDSSGGVAHSTPPTAGSSGSTSASTSEARGPGRLREDHPRAHVGLRGHFEASHRWLGVAAVATMYFGAVAVYLGTYAEGVQQLWAALQSPDPAIVAEALRDGRYGVPDVVTYAGQTGVVEGFTPGTGVTVLAGAMLLPVAVAVAISGLRRETTWRPSWMHVVGSLGPAAAGTSTYAVGNYPDAVPISAVPLLFDLLLLVGFPAVVLVSFFLNRLVVVYPLHRREDLGLP